MFLGCPEHCNSEGTLNKYSRNIAYRLGSNILLENIDDNISVKLSTPAKDIGTASKGLTAAPISNLISLELSPLN